jgi:hypothetical protein
MPQTLTVTLLPAEPAVLALVQATTALPASATNPVRSKTPFGATETPYSIHSAAPTLAGFEAIANLIVTADACVLQKLTLNTA